ncbi:MAG TPA: cytochrome ubiquinol oxidase subunit I [Anaerolineales bacterium]|nr:cytochrome ubiquinol oxidase subunit I [Anaerolineales bacterium]
MLPVILSRLQFALTTVYHFFFVPLTLGLVWFVAILETMYVRTGDETYKRLTKFWGKLLLINFAMGVVTGIVMEFQFGMNWAGYANYVGDIFGAPLAIEALLAFFLESTFLGLWIFGWDKLSKKLHAAVIWLVAVGSSLSALWILIANAFMQHPVGYVLNNGRAEMVDFGALVFNPKAWIMFEHTLASGLTTAAFFILGVSAYHLVRKQDVEFYKRSFSLASIVGTIAIVLVIIGGHEQGLWLLKNQPMKAAATEALWETEDPASFSILTIGDLSGRREVWEIRVPRVLSFLYYNQFTGEVPGMDDLQEEYQMKYGPGDYVPLAVFTYWGFRFMVASGFAMLALAGYTLYYVMRNKVGPQIRWLGLFVFTIALPYIANTSGWVLTEMGRQPFIVYGLLKTEDAMSPGLTSGMILFSLIGFALVYAALMGADVYLLTKYAKAGPAAAETESAALE